MFTIIIRINMAFNKVSSTGALSIRSILDAVFHIRDLNREKRTHFQQSTISYILSQRHFALNAILTLELNSSFNSSGAYSKG